MIITKTKILKNVFNEIIRRISPNLEKELENHIQRGQTVYFMPAHSVKGIWRGTALDVFLLPGQQTALW